MVTKGGYATSLGEEVVMVQLQALPKADKGSRWPPKLPIALRLCVHTQKLVCYSTHSATFLAWNYNSGTHYHVEKGTLGCITDIKEQFQNLVYELKFWAIKTYLDLHSESCCCCHLWPALGRSEIRGWSSLGISAFGSLIWQWPFLPQLEMHSFHRF